MADERDVRVRQVPERFDGKHWHTQPQEVALVRTNAWVIVRRADSPQAMPFVMSRKEWDKLPTRPQQGR